MVIQNHTCLENTNVRYLMIKHVSLPNIGLCEVYVFGYEYKGKDDIIIIMTSASPPAPQLTSSPIGTTMIITATIHQRRLHKHHLHHTTVTSTIHHPSIPAPLLDNDTITTTTISTTYAYHKLQDSLHKYHYFHHTPKPLPPYTNATSTIHQYHFNHTPMPL